MTRHDEAAALLLAVRRGESPRLDALPEPAAAPRTKDDAYAIQRAISAALGRIDGWKVGSPSPDATQFTCAPIPAGAVFEGTVTIEGSDDVVEAEIAVRLGRDLPPREAPYTLEEVRDAIASAHPALEVLQTRYVDSDAVDKMSGLADSLSNHSLVLGPAITEWQSVDLRTRRCGCWPMGARSSGAPAIRAARWCGWWPGWPMWARTGPAV